MDDLIRQRVQALVYNNVVVERRRPTNTFIWLLVAVCAVEGLLLIL